MHKPKTHSRPKLLSSNRLVLSILLMLFALTCSAKPAGKDTINMGIFIESVYDLDFAAYSYSTNFWMWSVVNGDVNGDGVINEADSIASMDRINMIELSNAKDYSFSHQNTTRTVVNGVTYWWAEQFCKATIYQKWALGNYPFDKQKLVLKFENSAYDTSQVIMWTDQDSLHFKKDINLIGWNILQSKAESHVVSYNTDFGDPNGNDTSSYSRVTYSIQLQRIDASGFFIKLCMGVFISFLVAMIVFGITPSNMDSRFGLGIGALFAVAANKYVVDSNIPQTATNCLVDKIHEMTFVYILVILICTIISLRIHESSKRPGRTMFDIAAGVTLLLSYAIVLICLLIKAHQEVAF